MPIWRKNGTILAGREMLSLLSKKRDSFSKPRRWRPLGFFFHLARFPVPTPNTRSDLPNSRGIVQYVYHQCSGRGSGQARLFTSGCPPARIGGDCRALTGTTFCNREYAIENISVKLSDAGQRRQAAFRPWVVCKPCGIVPDHAISYIPSPVAPACRNARRWKGKSSRGNEIT